jgi:peptidoglycan hydrolase-like protein with peptidoglycan-binding domain
MGSFSVRKALRALPAAVLVGAFPAAAVAGPSAPTFNQAPPRPVHATLSVRLGSLFRVAQQPVTVPGRSVAVSGVLRPYLPGVHVRLKAYLDGKPFKDASLQVRPTGNGRSGGYTTTLKVPRNGRVKVVVYRQRDAQLLAVKAKTDFTALNEQVGFGATGLFVKLLQQRLATLHLYVPQTGTYDTGTGNAVDAYRRLIGLAPAQTLSPAVVSHVLDGDGSFHVRYPSQGRHAEGDLSDQLLALINGSKVQLIFPISSGKPSTPTILGSYQVYLREPGYLSDGMYYSDFFIRGYAIHGYDPAPDYPASHGCMRLPIPDAITAYDWLAIGDWVDSYYT